MNSEYLYIVCNDLPLTIAPAHSRCPLIKLLLLWTVTIIPALDLLKSLQFVDPMNCIRPRPSWDLVARLGTLVEPHSMINVPHPENNIADDVQQSIKTRSAIAITSAQNQFQEVTQSVIMPEFRDCWPPFTGSGVYSEHTCRERAAGVAPMDLVRSVQRRLPIDKLAISYDQVPDL